MAPSLETFCSGVTSIGYGIEAAMGIGQRAGCTREEGGSDLLFVCFGRYFGRCLRETMGWHF